MIIQPLEFLTGIVEKDGEDLDSFRLSKYIDSRNTIEVDIVECVGGIRISCSNSIRQLQIRVLQDGAIFITTK
jgi:hypothetical protein